MARVFINRLIEVQGIFLFLGTGAALAAAGAVETPPLVVHDRKGDLSAGRVRQLADAAEETLDRILEFWSMSPRVRKLGKIRVNLDRPRGKRYGAVFHWSREGGRRVRVVDVLGVGRQPEMVAHKLMHAVFPSPDKLIRNMMGIPMEIRFGNPQTFSMCGFDVDDWAAALYETKSYIPLRELGPGHTPWGMSSRKGMPGVMNPARQHATYVEAGSFGTYVFKNFVASHPRRSM